MLFSSECVAQDPGGLVILDSVISLQIGVGTFKTFMFRPTMVFHIDTFNKCHSF